MTERTYMELKDLGVYRRLCQFAEETLVYDQPGELDTCGRPETEKPVT